jgi:hypothetical protein
MKQYLLCFLACTVLAVPIERFVVTLAWEPSPDKVVKYRVYVGTASGRYDVSTNDAGMNLQYTVTNLLIGTDYYFAATCLNEEGLESEFSNEVSTKAIRPNAPGSLKFIFRGVINVQQQ